MIDWIDPGTCGRRPFWFIQLACFATESITTTDSSIARNGCDSRSTDPPHDHTRPFWDKDVCKIAKTGHARGRLVFSAWNVPNSIAPREEQPVLTRLSPKFVTQLPVARHVRYGHCAALFKKRVKDYPHIVKAGNQPATGMEDRDEIEPWP